MLGLPGKLGMSGAEVWPKYLAGEIASIRNYCETDALNTYLVYLRWELIRGRFSDAEYQRECDLVRQVLNESSAEHLREFSQAWQ